jgi:hypothetical protein
MMNEENDPLEVIVQGGSIEANTVVYGVVQNALSNAGFTEVTVSSPQGDTAALVNKVPTMLDVVRASRPELFATRVTVKQNVPLEEIGSLIADNPDRLDLGHVVYGIGDAGDDDPGDASAESTQEAEKSLEPEEV